MTLIEAELQQIRERTDAEVERLTREREAVRMVLGEVYEAALLAAHDPLGPEVAAAIAKQDNLEALRARVEALEAGLQEILVGKTRADLEHPLGEWFSMESRFLNIARALLEVKHG